MIENQMKENIINAILNNQDLSKYQKYLFPSEHKEYILNYSNKMRKEDILSNNDGVFSCPIEEEKTFNGEEHPEYENGWKNLLVFADNLQFLKTIYENKDKTIKDKVKKKIKLIYIDPPFATEDEFQNKYGAKAYKDKIKGSDFLEFLRRRIIVARELLADDGFFIVHIDQKKGHYLKVIMDEIFSENNFVNEIIWSYRSGGASKKASLPKKHDTILVYRKSDLATVNPQYERQYLEKPFMDSKVDENGKFYTDTLLRDIFEGELNVTSKDGMLKYNTRPVLNLSSERIDYPTQKPEGLLGLLINIFSNPGDIVMDFFCGGGTTIAAAEKLNRRWLGCDIGKLSYYTVQKRLLTIQDSSSITVKQLYSKKAKSFTTAQLGLYSLEKTLNLDFEQYKIFVSDIFKFELTNKKIHGINFEGIKEESLVKVFDFNKFKNTMIDEDYLRNMHQYIGSNTNGIVYIVSPISFIDFFSDYYEIEDVRYYFYKVPYHVIKELEKVPFERSIQPKTKKSINNVDYAIGFHFISPIEVNSSITFINDKFNLSIDKFINHERINSFDTLSCIFIDFDFQNDKFIMDEAFFYDDFVLENNNFVLKTEINKKNIGNKIKIIYTDIYGNEFSEIIFNKE